MTVIEQAGIPWLRRGWEPPKPKPLPPEERMAYDFPLRRDMITRLVLPVNLTRSDADRINAFVSMLAFDTVAGRGTPDGDTP